MLYHAFEVAHAACYPARQLASVLDAACVNPANPIAYTPLARYVSASCRVFRQLTKRYGKPEFGIAEVSVGGSPTTVEEEVVLSRPFCELLHFRKEARPRRRPEPRVLLVAPLSGHYATLLRGTVRALLPEHDVYIADWRDARTVPLAAGRFDLDDYIDYVTEFVRTIGAGAGVHVVAVCQPAVAVLAATALMAARGDPDRPRSLTLMAGPVDCRIGRTVVNEHAESHSLEWFRANVITTVPAPHWGAFRRVYPGFLQLSGFMAMNAGRHADAYQTYFGGLIQGDADSVQAHRKFYDEYLAVMDLPAEYFLQTVETVFQRHAMALGEMTHRGEPVEPTSITDIALMTVEGAKDDICGPGQTEAAHDLCPNVADASRYRYVQPAVGHYGVFNGTRWRTEIAPRVAQMIRSVETRRRS